MENYPPARAGHPALYNVKAVSGLVGLPPVTLRAWERRYGLPSPARGRQGYRLYSEYDVRVLRWLKAQTEAGMSISRAAQNLAELRARGEDPVGAETPPAPAQPAVSVEALRDELAGALMRMDDVQAERTARRALALHPLEDVLEGVLRPAVVALGEAWHQGRVSMATERFASQFCLRLLMSLLGAQPAPSRGGVIVAAGAPGERHELGLLMLAVLLRARGWDVRYLGPDIQLEDLPRALRPLRPRLLLFSAARPETAERLRALPQVLERFDAPPPRVVLGGQAFAAGAENDWPGVRLEGGLVETVGDIERLMQAPELAAK